MQRGAFPCLNSTGAVPACLRDTPRRGVVHAHRGRVPTANRARLVAGFWYDCEDNRHGPKSARKKPALESGNSRTGSKPETSTPRPPTTAGGGQGTHRTSAIVPTAGCADGTMSTGARALRSPAMRAASLLRRLWGSPPHPTKVPGSYLFGV